MNSLGKAIREKREGLGMRQSDLAEKAGLSQGVISEWETGSKTPSLSSLFALRDALGVPPNEFELWLDIAGRRKRKGAA